MARTAVVLFNLGGPDQPSAVRPFLFNLFSDPAMIRLPGPLRWVFAQVISRLRARTAEDIYARIGDKSPILEETAAQAQALADELADSAGELKVFIAMRYWHPFASETVAQVAVWAPDRVVLLPLYPQYSTTTTASSAADWDRAAKRSGLAAPVHTVCCYPSQEAFIEAHADQIRDGLARARAEAPKAVVRVLFSAHGLPKRIVDAGDPYAWQVERTAAAIAAAVGDPDLDWRVCYQSRVGPLEWIGPATSEELVDAGAKDCAVVLAPIAFVSEHSETLVELDIQYRRLADQAGVAAYVRVPALGKHPGFVAALADMTRAALDAGPGGPVCSAEGGRLCPAVYSACPSRAKQEAA